MKLIKELKSGQAVVLTHEGTRMAVVLEKNSIDCWNIDQNYCGFANNAVDKHGFKYRLPLCGHEEDAITRYQIIPLTEDISCVYQGARIKNAGGEREVLSVSGRVVMVSISDTFDIVNSVSFTIEELRAKGYKLILPDWVKGDKKEENMITIKGKEYSEDTLHKAIKEYVK